ncbi:MAG TPA: 2-dehydropantoate 2-reductase N-terminal domain-containing protein [Bryobacteraceae bacterium]|nr:2-dehydropantoate 2-reductase N-terminal domain-containing protein [Bryobacteraceae bacterium]
MQRMIVIGTGPIGGIIGGRLARAGADITFVDIDREHVSAIREKGLYVDVPDGPFNVKVKILYPHELHEISGKFDIGFIAVRSNYTADALNTVLPHLASDGLLVSMQNGINPPLLQEKVGADRTLGMAIRMGCRKIGPGHVQTDIRGHLYLGHLHGKTTPPLEALHKSLNAVMETDISDNILGVLWSKLTYTCLGYYGSLADASLSTTCTTEADRRAMADFFTEIVAVGDALGVRWIELAEYSPADFHPRHSADQRLATVNNFAKTWKPKDRKGPLRYVQNKLRTEVEFTLAYVVKEGEKLGMKMPLCSKLLEIFRELEAGKRQFGQHNYDELLATAR